MFEFLPWIALSKVTESVEDKIDSSVGNAIPVFMMKDLQFVSGNASKPICVWRNNQ